MSRPARRGHRGRPRSATARRRATTTAGRRPPADFGSPELILRKPRAGNGSAAPVELVDVAGILAAHELIEPKELTVLRLLAGWLHELRVAFGLPAASPGGLWAALLSGQRADRNWMVTGTGRTSGDRAAFRLDELFRHFARLDQLEVLRLCCSVAISESWPPTARDLLSLRDGLQIIGELHRRSRREAQAEAVPPIP